MIDLAKVPDIDPDVHPIGNYRKITKWMVDFCEGDFVEAILLSFFLAMYHSQRKYFLDAVRKNKIFQQTGLTRKESESIELIYSYQEIANYIFNTARDYKTLKDRINRLAARKVITIKKALTTKDKNLLGVNTRLSTDRTNIYLFHPTPLIEYLQPYLSIQNEHDNEIQNSINLLEGKGILQKTKDGYFMPFQNKKSSGATAHLKKFQLKEKEVEKKAETKQVNDSKEGKEIKEKLRLVIPQIYYEPFVLPCGISVTTRTTESMKYYTCLVVCPSQLIKNHLTKKYSGYIKDAAQEVLEMGLVGVEIVMDSED